MEATGKKNIILATLIAMVFLFNPICMGMNLIFPDIVNFGDRFIILLLIAGILCCFPKIKIYLGTFLLCISILILMLASYVYRGFSPIILDLLKNYVVWGIVITFFMMQPYNKETFVKVAYVISFIVIVVDLTVNTNVEYSSMTWSYSVFPCLAVMMIHFIYFRFRSVLGKLSYIPGFLILIKFLIGANRGGFFSLAFLFYFIISKKVISRTDKVKNRTIVSVIILILVVFVALNFEEIVFALYNMLAKADIDITSIDKMYRLIMSNNLTNNRTELYAFAWDGFLESPLFGKGIGAFSINYGGWTHNFILQILYEGGILLFSLIMIPMGRVVGLFIGDHDVSVEDYAMFTLFFCTSIPKLLFSTELWRTQGFWMLFVFGLMVLRMRKCNKVIK